VYADLKKSVVLAGLYNRLEIWNEKNWEVYKKKVEQDAETVAEQLGDLGI
jgi:MraZ protein